jgi:hypothetical protein
VVWEEPDEAEIDRYQELGRRMRFRGQHGEYRLSAAGKRATDGHDQDQDWLTAADWMDADADEEVQPPTPIWRISAGAARRLSADLDQPILAAAGNRLAGVARLPSDPVIKHIHVDGSHVSYHYPGTAIVIDEAGPLRVAGALPGSGGVAAEGDGRVWLLGFDQETDEDPASSARQLLLDEGRLAAPLDLRLVRPVAVVGRFVVDIGCRHGAGEPGFAQRPRVPVVCFVPIDGGEHRTVEAPGLSRYPGPEVRACDGEVWLGNPGAGALTVAAPGRTHVRELALTLDIRPWMPRPLLPDDLDPVRFEQAQLDHFRRWFLGGPPDHPERNDPDQPAGAEPFIDGVSFDAVELRGEFPDCEVVATFQAADRPGIRFARRWRLYDELGNPCDHEYARVYLEEDILAGSGGLPPLDRCVPDVDGLVWFQQPVPASE